MYATKYIVPFISLKGTSYKVEIQTEGYMGTAKELVGSATPFVVKLDDNDFLYSPCRFSTASLSLVGDDYLQELFSTNYQQYRIVLKSGTNVVWVGFVSPEIYTQDYANIPFELEVQCSSAMATLEYLDYKKAGEACTFVSLFDVLKQCVKSSNADYSNIFVPHVYASSEAAYTANENVFEKMTISEQNFFDEDGKALKLKEVLEEVCKFLGWTCVDAFGSLYFVDVDYRGDYLAYSGDFSSVATRSFAVMNVQQIGFAGDDHTLDILGGYSKASVKASNYGAGDLSPKEEYDNLVEITQMPDVIEEDSVSVKKILSPINYKMLHYEDSATKSVVTKDLAETASAQPNKLLGAFPVRCDNYKMVHKDGKVEADITDYSFEDLIQVRLLGTTQIPCIKRWVGNAPETKPISISTDGLQSTIDWYTPAILGDRGVIKDSQYPHDKRISGDLVISYEDTRAVTYADAAISIDMGIQLSRRTDLAYLSILLKGDGTTPNIKYCYKSIKLSIGDNYYDGKKWTKDNNAFFNLEFDPVVLLKGEYSKNPNMKKLETPYTGLQGYIIVLPPSPAALFGALKIEMFALNIVYSENYSNPHGYFEQGIPPYQITGYFVKDLKISYKMLDTLISTKTKNSDRIYENVVNDKYINEYDSIELKINSYNNDDISFSKVLLNGKYLTDNLYCKIANKLIRPEEQLIRRIINQYSATKIKLKQVLIYSDAITPVTRLSDNYTVNRVYMVSGGEIDFAAAKFDINMIEIV